MVPSTSTHAGPARGPLGKGQAPPHTAGLTQLCSPELSEFSHSCLKTGSRSQISDNSWVPEGRHLLSANPAWSRLATLEGLRQAYFEGRCRPVRPTECDPGQGEWSAPGQSGARPGEAVFAVGTSGMDFRWQALGPGELQQELARGRATVHQVGLSTSVFVLGHNRKPGVQLLESTSFHGRAWLQEQTINEEDRCRHVSEKLSFHLGLLANVPSCPLPPRVSSWTRGS